MLSLTSTAQESRKAYLFTGIVYDEQFVPLPYTHVIAEGSGQGDVTDSLGIFTLYVRETDRLSFYNLTCRDSSVIISIEMNAFNIKLKRRMYPLREAKIFEWGSSYNEFLAEVKRQGPETSLSKKMGLPQQDPGVIPFDMDEKNIKSPGFLISSPISFLYYNLSKYEKSLRKAYKLEQNKDLIGQYEQILSAENIGAITKLDGQELEKFIIYLNSKMSCTYKCSELELIIEIHEIWKRYNEEIGDPDS